MFCLASVKSLIGTEQMKDKVQKKYFKTHMTLPLSLCMRKRPKDCWLNINERVKFIHSRFETYKPTVCMNDSLFGIMGNAKYLVRETKSIKFEIDREAEEMKLQNPFFGLTFLQKELGPQENDILDKQKYWTDNEIEESLKLPGGTVHKITSSFVLGYDIPGKDSRQVVDLGLNMKNYFKKCHIPGFVRYIVEDGPVEELKNND